MKIKIGKLYKDVTCHANKYWIQVEDTPKNNNSNLDPLVGKEVSVIIDSCVAIDELLQEVDQV